jgi:hypothetical protein
MLSLLLPIAIVAVVVIIAVLAFQRGREGFDLSSNAVVRSYLYLGLFAGVLALAFGFAALLNAVLAAAAGNEFVYGGVAGPPACPPGVDCARPPVQVFVPAAEGLERRRLEDVVRGVTFVLFGALFYVAHRWAFGTIYPRGTIARSGDSLRRAYLLVGTVVFGIGAIALLPLGVYQAIANAVLPRSDNFFRPGVADSLTGGLVSLVFWLIYLRSVLDDARGGSPRSYRAGPSGPPAEPAPVGARIGPRPGERSAGAEAQPPQQFRRVMFVRPGERIAPVVRPGPRPEGD